MRKGLAMVVVLLMVSCLMAAAAYSSATVTNDAEIKVANTNQALVALGPHDGVGNLDQTAYLDDGNLLFEFGRGQNPSFGGDQNYGFQKNSEYVWWNDGDSNTGMFYIQNRSAENVQLTLETKNIPAGVTIEFNQSMGDGGNGWQDATNQSITLPRTLSSGNTCDINVRITVDDNANVQTTNNLEVIVGSTAIN